MNLDKMLPFQSSLYENEQLDEMLPIQSALYENEHRRNVTFKKFTIGK